MIHAAGPVEVPFTPAPRTISERYGRYEIDKPQSLVLGKQNVAMVQITVGDTELVHSLQQVVQTIEGSSRRAFVRPIPQRFSGNEFGYQYRALAETQQLRDPVQRFQSLVNLGFTPDPSSGEQPLNPARSIGIGLQCDSKRRRIVE